MAPLNVPLHPVELYEILAYLLVFLLVWQTRDKYKADGLTFLTYVAGYGVARIAVEFFRGNPAIFAWGIPAAQVWSVALILASIAAFRFLARRRG
jgi:phosphatidylglycerol:prolipoprotein diacylglycerol transferase